MDNSEQPRKNPYKEPGQEQAPEAQEKTQEEQSNLEQEPVLERTKEEQQRRQEIERQAEELPMTHELEEAHHHINAAQTSDDQAKVQQLITLAREKGVVAAVKIAKESDNAHLVDLLHDTLAREGFYKTFE